MSSYTRCRGELPDGGLKAAPGSVGALRVVAARASARFPALIENSRHRDAARDGGLVAVPRGPGYCASKTGNDKRVDRGMRHEGFEPGNRGLKLRDAGDERFELGDAGAQAVELGALPLPVLASAVSGIASLPG